VLLFTALNVKNNKVDHNKMRIYTILKICQIPNQQSDELEGLRSKPKSIELEKANIRMQ